MTDPASLARSSEPSAALVAVELSDQQRRATVVALRDRLFETKRYIDSSGFTPCHPTCEHCRPRVEHFAVIQADLVERKEIILSVLALLDPEQAEASEVLGTAQPKPERAP